MPGGEVEGDAVVLIAEERGAAGLSFKDAVAAFGGQLSSDGGILALRRSNTALASPLAWLPASGTRVRQSRSRTASPTSSVFGC